MVRILENKVYIIYDWSMEEVIIATRSKEKALAKIGEDFLSGDEIDNYKFIENNLDEVED